MNTTVPQPVSAPLPRFSKENRPTVSWTDLHEVLKSVSPLSEWESEFTAWREQISVFRQVEQDSFFRRRDEVVLKHLHRGWMADLISEGEKLAIELLRLDTDAVEPMQFLNLCIENLQNSLEVWHSTLQQSEGLRVVPQPPI